MAGAWDDEDRVMMAAVMHDNEVSAEDYGDRVEEVMCGGGSSGRGGQGLDNDGNGSSNDKR